MGKKDNIMPSFRVEEDLKRRFYAALSDLGIPRPVFSRSCMAALVRQHEAGEQIAFPIQLVIESNGRKRR